MSNQTYGPSPVNLLEKTHVPSFAFAPIQISDLVRVEGKIMAESLREEKMGLKGLALVGWC